MVSWVRCGTWLYKFMIFATFLKYVKDTCVLFKVTLMFDAPFNSKIVVPTCSNLSFNQVMPTWSNLYFNKSLPGTGLMLNLYSLSIHLSETDNSLSWASCWDRRKIYESMSVIIPEPSLIDNVIWAVTCDFQQCGILTCVDSEEPVWPRFKLKASKWCSVSSLTLIDYSSD